MSKIKRIAAAAVATAGLTTGVIVMASPAMAAPGYATYSCTGFGSVDTEFVRSGTALTLNADLSGSGGYTVPTGGATINATLDGVGTPTATLAAGHYDTISLTSGPSFPTLTHAPSQIILSIPGGTPSSVTCNLSADNGGWNV